MNRIKRIAAVLLVITLSYLVYYCWDAFPILTGYSAKMACSCMFLGDRTLKSVEEQELGNYPLKLASVEVLPDSSVVATVAGMAKQIAVYRPGLGCTLVNEITKEALKKQVWQLPAVPGLDPDTIDWPMGDRIPVREQDSVIPNQKELLLQQAVQAAFVNLREDQPVRTRAVVVVHKGELVAEQYAPGFDRHHRQLSWSMAKSITGTLIGMLVKERKLSLDQPAPVASWKTATDGRAEITLRHLLQQTSGLDFEENYSKATDATNMLFRKADMAAYTASHALKVEPGSNFYYSSGNSNILSGILRNALGDSLYHRYPYEKLFYKLGMYSAVMETDASGNFVGSSYVYATPRDWARLGLLYLQNGNWNNEQLLPENWVQLATQPVPVAPQGEYGFQIWLNAGNPIGSSNRKYLNLPADLYYFSGYEGQQVLMIPSKELVIVRLGQTANSQWFDTETFVNRILTALQ
jgi:CubicO group peptidase (beta-lactamase class C family)